jgi:hypothetical protein
MHYCLRNGVKKTETINKQKKKKFQPALAGGKVLQGIFFGPSI